MYKDIKIKTLILCLCSFYFNTTEQLMAQSVFGEVQYSQTNDWTKIATALPYLSQEEKDRIQFSWGKGRAYSEKMRLIFNDTASFYSYIRDDKSEESIWSYKKNTFEINRNFRSNKMQDRIGLLGKNYIVKDEIPKRKWKIHNEIKEVSGYVCMKAETYDSVKSQRIIAWFTDKILVPAGPAEFGGLPGLILEIDINDQSSLIVAEEVKLNQQTQWPSINSKGKSIDYKKYQGIVKTYIADCIERRRNPFWDLRY